ncbi:MAG: PilX N-terminal domain-containing pilus assembly protein [Gemmatimonadota bacterium]
MTKTRGAVRNERGSTLMIVLVALVGLTALAAAGMVMTETELRASENHEAGTNAFYVADAGLQQYLGTKEHATSTDTFTYAVGSAIVQGEKILDLPDDRVLYRVRSVSTYTPPEGGTASRTISRLAIYSEGSIVAKASFAAGKGLLKTGNAGTLSGEDQDPGGNPNCPDSPKPDVAGVAVPPSGYSQSGGGGSLVPEGDPDVLEAASSLDLLISTGVPWDAIVNEGLLVPDYEIPSDAWPNFASLPADEWPTVYVTGDITLGPGDSGRGTLIVEDNLTMNGSFEWDGVVLVGGYLTSNGFQTVAGTTITGLNELLGETVPASDLGNGNKKFLYDSCKMKMAMKAAFGGLSEVPGSWAERWQ